MTRNNSSSAVNKMQHQYWVTKQTVFRKLGKKEDECIVASDAELDAKLELLRSIQDSCLELKRIIDRYQEKLYTLAQEEDSMGRFLKESGKHDKTRAGQMMTDVGEALSYSGQKRISLRKPLLRLYQEVDTFRHTAIEDMLENVQAMEKARTEYRASLKWMKKVSQELDPDAYKQLEQFRKVQEYVKRSKLAFDRQKLDCLQKVDLLAAARCNMFSRALILYQSTLLKFTEKSVDKFTVVAKGFKGYQHYDFCVVKELAELKPASDQTEPESDKNNDDKLLDFDEEKNDKTEEEEIDKKETQENDDKKLVNDTTDTNKDIVDLGLVSDELVNNDNSNNNSTSSSTLLAGLLNCSSARPDDIFLPSQLLSQPQSLPTAEKITKNDNQKGTNASSNQTGKPSWLDLFAELDPLANPDAVGKTKSEDDRNC
ncbi:islet cell autoantigen 1-like protein isoform X2 [Lycorma delicatula]